MTEPAAKPSSYFDNDRTDFLEWVGPVGGAVLEIGCGTGRNAAWLRGHGAVTLVGIEPDVEAATRASDRFDIVYTSPVEAVVHELRGPFDLIICADVLEHLVDPWTVSRRLRDVSGPATVLAISIPNARHYRVLWDIAFGSGFAYPLDGTYDPRSIFDTTHLRFFTRANINDLLSHAGWAATRWGVPPRRRLGRLRRLASWLTRGWVDEWATYQWYVVAHPAMSTVSRSKALP